jgi:nucleoside-diphosphate-sugar epimerase
MLTSRNIGGIMKHKGTVLVLGATGGIGGEVARQMRDAGWNVRAMKRGLQEAGAERDGITWVRGDALNPRDVTAAAQGAAVIVHAVNPPGYRNWGKVVLPMLDSTIAAANIVGATVVLPGTIYNFGPDAFPVLTENSPQRPLTRKGAIRVAMEQRLRAYADNGGRVLIVRAGDFFGPRAGNNWFAQGIVKAGRPVKTLYRPGDRGVGHEWSYLPDVARTIVELLDKVDTLEPFASFHMAGHWDPDGTRLSDSISRVVARRTGRQPKVVAFPWWMFKEMQEMRYLWRNPLRMDNSRLKTVLGYEPHTPLDVAVETTLQALGCVDAAVTSPFQSDSTSTRHPAGR